MNWTVTLDEFDDVTPFGMKRFTNIIATLNPSAQRRLILAAHYDSKYFPDDGTGKYFLAATDSAIPCAMLVEIARVVTPLFRARVQEQANMAGADDDVSHCENECNAGSEIALSWSPMRLKILCWRPDFHNWSPVGD